MSKVTIDADFLRKRAEHNEGCLNTLEEIALHQQNIERIENFDKLIRHVKILLLQNNLISKMENLSKLKELEYLNLALNNIKVIEGLEGCESLEKLDMTCNFIGLDTLFESLLNLKKVPSLREIHFMGNPFTDWDNYRKLVVAMVPQLVTIDSKEITPKERIEAVQLFDHLCMQLEEEILKKQIADSKKSEEERQKEYTPEARTQMYKEQQAAEEEKERLRQGEKPKKKPISSMYNKDGEMRQCNEGRYEYKLREWDDPEWSYFEMILPQFLDTSQINCELFPHFVSVRVKEKLTQVQIHEEIIVSESKVQRSQTTGVLLVTMKKAKIDELLIWERNKEKQKKEKAKQEIEKIKEANISEVREKQKKKEQIEKKILEDEELEDLPPLE